MRVVDNKFLTKRESDILLLILHGKNKREIADDLCISVSTVKTITENIYRKCNVHNKVELVVFLIKNNLVVLEDNSF